MKEAKEVSKVEETPSHVTYKYKESFVRKPVEEEKGSSESNIMKVIEEHQMHQAKCYIAKRRDGTCAEILIEKEGRVVDFYASRSNFKYQ